MHRVLLVYQTIPDNMTIYLLEVNGADFAMLKQCHGVLCNVVGVAIDHPVNTLCEWLEPYKDKIIYDENDPEKYPVQEETPLNATLIVSGFLL